VKEGNDGNIKILLTARVVDIGYSVMINESLGTSCSTIQNYEEDDIVVLSGIMTLLGIFANSVQLGKPSIDESNSNELGCERSMHCGCLFTLWRKIK
jgi:hypothetical protein